MNKVICSGLTDEFLFKIGMYQESTLSPFLFSIIMDEIVKSLQDEISHCMLFADNIVLIDEIKEDVNTKLKLWR